MGKGREESPKETGVWSGLGAVRKWECSMAGIFKGLLQGGRTGARINYNWWRSNTHSAEREEVWCFLGAQWPSGPTSSCFQSDFVWHRHVQCEIPVWDCLHEQNTGSSCEHQASSRMSGAAFYSLISIQRFVSTLKEILKSAPPHSELLNTIRCFCEWTE